MLSCSKESTEDSSGLVKVALRNVGHQLLLLNQDSVSVVKPVKNIDYLKYQLSFEEQLIINPDSLITLVKISFQKANLTQHYLVEVIQCKDNEIAYSYKMNQNVEKGIIPCRGRQLQKECYLINVQFTDAIKVNKSYSYSWLLYVLLFVTLEGISFLYFKRKNKVVSNHDLGDFLAIGKYKFYPEQNKLIKEANEINLSKKECELLTIFIAQPNQIIKRDELTKKVWEDNGVFVGRSLDTYISKLRLKLKHDESVKLINIHGVGYKLVIGN
uniref:winged helix-turn-helix domain-containing protein n=1 Tax=Flavobacterium sp. TaxID=239 RepID=UPI004049C9E8